MRAAILTILVSFSLFAQLPKTGSGGGGSGAGSITSIIAGQCLSGGTITTAGTISSIGACYAAGTGTAQAQTATYSPAIGSLVTGLTLSWLPSNANTGAAPTFAPNGLAAKAIVKVGGAALVANDLTATAIATAIYDGTNWELQNPQTGSGGSGTHGLTFVAGGPGSTVTTSSFSATLPVLSSGTLKSYQLAMASGDVPTGPITVTFWKIAAGTSVPTIANLINTAGVSTSGTNTATAVVTTLTDFTTTTFTAGDMVVMAVTAVSGAVSTITALLAYQ